MSDSALRPNVIPWPPLLYLAAAALAVTFAALPVEQAVALHWVVPLPWFGGIARMVLAAAGLCGMCAALALEIVTALTFRRHRTTIWPNRGATALITEGPFAKSRNPIYVGNTLLMLGAGLLFGIAWFVPLGLAAAFAVQKLAIEREERHLALRFGAEWDAYAARTPRWLW